jgi:hypothetical protein
MFFCVLKVTEDFVLIRMRVQIRIQGSASGSVSKCHGSGTLLFCLLS